MSGLVARARETAERLRAARPAVDHLMRAAARYKADGGNRLAASMTYYGFLAVMPLLLLVMSALGYALAGNVELQTRVVAALTQALPGVGDQVVGNLAAVQRYRGLTGLVGLVGLLFAGLGGIDAVREALRTMWHQRPEVGNVVRTKLHDVVTLVGLGATLLASYAVTALGAGLLAALLRRAGVAGAAGRTALSVASLLLALVADTALFVYLFRRMPRIDWPLARVLRGAVFGAVGFGLIKVLGTSYVARTTTRSTALYGAIGTAIGVLVGINLICRYVMFTAAWTVTAPGSDDVLPSATAAADADAAPAGAGPAGAAPAGAAPEGAAPEGAGPEGTGPAGAAPAAPAPSAVEAGTRSRSRPDGVALVGLAALVALLGLRGFRALRRS